MNNKKILLVDDDPRVRNLVSMTLGKQFTILQAENGARGLEMAARELPDMVFLDVEMPEMSGFDVCIRIKSNQATAGIKVVMLTGHAKEEEIDRGRAAGADDYFTKPFSPRALLQKVTEILA
ncbi:MAG: response regulator [Chloroflexi bacterium]|nr:response regulator [Chloroflexota bacterium]